MSLLNPVALLLALLALPIILLYMLRLRRRDLLVSSTWLWQRLLRDREANAPWQRLRRNLLLLLQLLLLAALVLALARPFIPVPSVVSGSVVVLLDGSASMLATDLTPNRMTVAKEQVSRLIGQLGSDDQMTVILVGRTPTVLAAATSDRDQLRRALEGVQATPAAADWPAAFALASGAAQGFQEARIVIVSDGGLPETVPPLPAELVYLPVGTEGENLALAALATRQTASGPQLFTSVVNYGQAEREAILSISYDGNLFDSRRLVVPAGERIDVVLDLPEEAVAINARLSDAVGDQLAADNSAWAVHEGGLRNKTLLITEGNRFLETVFTLMPGIELFRSRPAGAGDLEEDVPFDLYVLDSIALPPSIPEAELLIINPQAGEANPEAEQEPLLAVTGVFTTTQVTRVTDSPLLQFVDWGDVHVRQAQRVEAPWAVPLVMAEGGPLLLAGERDGRRAVIVPFRLQDSDLPLQIAFPVLMANITSWLNPGRTFSASATMQPGDPISFVPGAGTTAVMVQKPDGSVWRQTVGQGPAVFAETDQLGLYEVTLRDVGGDRSAGSFAVNLFAPEESAIGPNESLQIGSVTVAPAVQENVGQRELWPWIAALALGLLLIEWWVYHRGTNQLEWSSLAGQVRRVAGQLLPIRVTRTRGQ